ncbi:MAG: ferric iron reductase [Bdellovibrionaceae bacterium]|nr:ferric iron reductase [Pseudobdellovibrionaceae bacterium]
MARIIFFWVSLLWALACAALNEVIERLVNFEVHSNAAAVRSAQMIMLPHIEIPLEIVKADFAKTLDLSIAQSLIFDVNGKKYVRWILNPEDTRWGEELIEYLHQKHGLKLTRKYYFHGYQTSSRSYIAEDPKTGAVFSVKSSTNVTGGIWRDKKQPVGDAIDSRLISDFLVRQNRLRPFEKLVFLEEPAILAVKAVDQAVVIRDLGPMKDPKGKRFYLPGFSALHETTGAAIAAINGSDDPYEFWTEHYIKVAGRALGELAARTGIQLDSPHSQNFLIELDEKKRPTGRLVIRDLADVYIDRTMILALDGESSPVLKRFSQSSNILDGIQAGFGPLHGNKKPTWVTAARYSQWKDVFFKEFEASFERITGQSLSPVGAVKYQNGDYFSASYKLSGRPEYKGFFASIKAFGYVPTPVSGRACGAVFN